jgi:dipeptidyl aminopeptidase/acylaminoacyl peptidase
MRTLALVLLPLLVAAPLRAQSVEAAAGNILYRPPCGAEARTLTRSGRDSEPRLSPDGAQVAFVRASAGPADGEPSSIWIVRTDGSGLRRLVQSRADEAPERNLEGLRSPVFSPDGARVYFLSAAWATSNAVHVADLATGEERFLIPGNSVDVVPGGRYGGHLLVDQHRYHLGGGSYDWTWLFTPDGREAGSIGETQASVREFLEEEAGPLPQPACR